jgi:Nuclease-related domain
LAYDLARSPGGFAKAREASHRRVALLLLVLALVAGLLSFALVINGNFGVVPAVALLGAAFAASQLFDVRLDQGLRWGKGGNAEIVVGTELELLREEGYTVMHDLDRIVAGNVDHFVSGSTGAFLIETKFRSYANRDIPKVKRVAKSLAHDIGVSWIQPVICCAKRDYGPRTVKGVAVVGRAQLLPYLRSQRNPVVSFDRLAAFADRQ